MNKSRIITILVVAIASVGFFAWIINSYVLDSQAAEDTVDVLINPREGLTPSTPVSFIIQPQDNTQTLSGADIVVNVENGTLTGWEDCTTLQGQSDIFTELTSSTGETARYACAALKNDAELPNHVIMAGSFTCSGTDTMRVSIDTGSSQVSGPIQSTIYEFGNVETAEFDCSGGGSEDPTITQDIIADFTPDTCSAEVGGECSYNLDVRSRNNSDQISGLYVKLEYDEDVLDYGSVVAQSNTQSVQGVSSNLLAQAGGQCGGTCTPDPANPQGSCDAGLTCIASDVANTGTCVNTISSLCTPANPCCSRITPTTSITVTPTPSITITPTPTGPLTGTPSATLTPSVTLLPSPPVSTTPTVPQPVPAGCKLVTTQDGDGYVEYLYTCDASASELPTALSQTITLKAQAQGSGDLTIAAIEVVGPQTQGVYSVHKGKATYDIGGGTQDGNVVLNMSMRAQCVTQRPKGAQEIKARIGLGDGPLQNPVYKEVTLSVDDDGHWNGSTSFNVPAGSGYKILPKLEKHMQKKVCVNNPSEDFPGAYGCDRGQITLQEGVNTIDLTNIVLLTGDLPPGEQDGISNAKDQSLVRNLIGKRDAESAALADINYDGVVNAVDHSCMIAALSVRWDEE